MMTKNLDATVRSDLNAMLYLGNLYMTYDVDDG